MSIQKKKHLLDYGIVYWFFVLTFLIQSWFALDNHYTIRFLCLSIGALLFFFFYRKPIQNSKLDLIGLALVVYYAMALISLFWAVNPSAGFLQLQTILLLIVCFFYFINFTANQIDHILHRVIPILSVLALLPAIWQFSMILLQNEFNEEQLYFITGFNAHKNLLGSYLFMLMGFNFFAYTRKKERKSLVIGFVLLIFALLLFSRSTFLAICSGIFILGLYLLTNRKTVIRIIKAVIGSIIVLWVFFIFVTSKSTSFEQNFQRYNPATYINSFSGSERLFIWYKTKELIKDEWLWGYGIGNWKLLLPSKSLAGSYRMQEKNVVFTRVHNDFLEVWAETGILGFSAFLFVFLFPIFQILKNKNKDPGDYIILWMFLGYGIISFFDFPKERIEHQILFALLLTIFVRINDKTLFTFNYPVIIQKILNVFILIGLSINIYGGVLILRGEYFNKKGIIAFNTRNWPELKKNMGKAYSAFYKISPIGVSIKWREGIADYWMQDFKEAEKNFKSGLNEAPHQFSLLNDYASTLVQLEKYEEAENMYYRVLEINPKYEEALFNLSFTLTQLKRYEEALMYLEKTSTQPEKKTLFLAEINKLKMLK